MKKIILFILVWLTLSITSVSAQVSSPSPSPLRTRNTSKITEIENKQEEIRNKIEARQQALEAKKEALANRNQERKATMEAKLLEVRTRQVQKLFNITYRRYQAAITRLETLITRINKRLAIYKDENPELNTVEIETQLQNATTKLAEAKTALEAVNTNLETVLASENPKESFIVLKDELKAIKESIKEVHSILVHVIGDIKGLRIGNSESQSDPTPTATGGEQ
jgi:exonuclease VII large subunit